MKRLLQAVAVSGALGVLLAGCSGDEPRPKMTPPSSAATTSPSPAPSVGLPPTQSPEVLGPVQTVRAWIQAQNMALKSGDMAALGRLSARECKTCEQLVAPIREVYDAGGRFETKGWVVEAAKVRDPGAQPEEVDAAITITAGRTFPTSTGEPVVYEEDKRILRFTLVREGGQRVVSFVGFLS